MNKRHVLEGEIIIAKRIIAASVLLGAPALLASGRLLGGPGLTPVNFALIPASLFALANVMVFGIYAVRPDLLDMAAMMHDMKEGHQDEMIDELLGVEIDDEE